MPFRIDYRDRVDELAQAAVFLIDTEGVEALSLRRLAGVLRVSPSTLLSHLESKHRMIDLVTKRIGDALVRSVDGASTWRGLEAVVPDDELLPALRAWLGLCELARASADREAAVARIRADLRHVLGRLACLPADDDQGRDALAALVHGLWVARAARTAPMPLEQALATLRHACAALGIDASPAPDVA